MRTNHAGLVGLALLVASAAFTIGCEGDGFEAVEGSGDVVQEARPVQGFDRLAVSGAAQVDIALDGTESLVVTTDDNLLPLIESGVAGDLLELVVPPEADPSGDVAFTVTAASMRDITVNGSGVITVSPIGDSAFSVTVNGSGEVAASGTTGAVTLEINGSGSVTASGSADTLDVRINGSGRYEGDALVVASASVAVGGSGTAVVNVTERLEVRVDGSGTVEYVGDPQIESSISGSGTISPAG